MDTLEIVDFKASHAAAFYELNTQWLKEHYKVESIDEEVLSSPQSTILDKKGEILVAEYNGEAVGVVALLPENDSVELTKMAVNTAYRGKGIGKALMDAAIKKTKELDIKRIELFTEPIKLRPAFLLYLKYGFTEIPFDNHKYARSNCKMERYLSNDFTETQIDSFIEEYKEGITLISTFMHEIFEETFNFKPSPQTWSIREQLNHIADCEANAYVRLRRFVAEPDSTILAWNQDKWNKHLPYQHQTWEDTLSIFTLLRKANYNLLKAIDKDIFDYELTHEETGKYKLIDWLLIYKNHTHHSPMRRNLMEYQKQKH